MLIAWLSQHNILQYIQRVMLLVQKHKRKASSFCSICTVLRYVCALKVNGARWASQTHTGRDLDRAPESKKPTKSPIIRPWESLGHLVYSYCVMVMIFVFLVLYLLFTIPNTISHRYKTYNRDCTNARILTAPPPSLQSQELLLFSEIMFI